MRHLFGTLLLLGILYSEAHAKAYFQGMDEMITKAEAIAIVQIDAVREAEVQGGTWIYRQAASATVVDLLRGDLPHGFSLYGSETFICARCPLAAGTYLAFLKKDGDLWTGSNWHLSLRAISGDKVAWHHSDETLSDMSPIPLEQVISEIRGLTSH